MILILSSSLAFTQQKWPNTLLWRISGKGLQKPSYLYGTMHLQDKRLFQFSDSLYTALEQVEGFALEIDFNEFMDSIFSASFRNAEERMLEDGEEVKIDKKKIDKSVDSILKMLNIKSDKITKKDLKKIREYRTNKLLQQGEMPTIVDGYLYGLAWRHNKWIGGIEDVSDQLHLRDELGGDLSPEEVFQPEKVLRQSLEEMISIYIKKDLQSLADYIDGKYSKDYVEKLLTQRNKKMARRMDSLSKLRTMFFAVGAAHLPGDEGVISLLRKKGFMVEPVFSPQSLSPEEYSGKLSAIPWKKIDDNEFYTVEMPGQPSEYNIFGEAAKMKVFFDLTTMTFYMSGHTIGGDNNLDKNFANMSERMGGNAGKIKTKDVSVGDLIGREGNFDIPQASFRVRLMQKKNILYILMVGSTKKSNLNTKEVDKFFTSFHPKEILPKDKKWTEFTIPGKGFTVKVPGNPKAAKAIDKRAEGTEWTFTTYDMADLDKGLYYLIQIRDINPGYFLEGDSTYFKIYRDNIAGKLQKLLKGEQFYYQGWPAFKIKVQEQENIIYEIFNVVRGNRVYCLIAGGASNADFSDIDKVFNSLNLQPYAPSAWEKQSSEGFTTTAPSLIKNMERDSLEIEAPNRQHLASYDENEVMSYEIFKDPLTSYYWIKNDSIFFEARVLSYKGYADSIVQRQNTYNGNLKGVDIVIKKPENNTLKKVRMFVNGDTLYTLLAFVPKQYINNQNIQKFFDDFRISNEIQPTIYTNKSKQLFEALKAKDSAAFEKAYSVLSSVEFSKEDLPVLHTALTEDYIKTENTYVSVNNKIATALEELADASTVQFVSDNYAKLNGEKEELKYTVLQVLANIKTEESYHLLKKLLLTSLPKKGKDYGLSYKLKDSLELTKILYPEILRLSGDSTFNEIFVDVTNVMFDSSMISINDVLPYKNNFLSQARRSLKMLKQNEENYWWSYWGWINFIGKFNDKEANDLLQEFLKLKDISIRYSAAIALLKNGQMISTTEVEKFAADNDYRKDLYEELKKLNKLKLFPPKYATQIKIAESELYQNVTDEDPPSAIIYIGERTADFMGKKQKFYLFKVTFGEEDYKSSYLGITGPYSISSKEIITSSGASGAYWDKEYDKLKIEKHFKKYLADTEEWMKKSKENKQ